MDKHNGPLSSTACPSIFMQFKGCLHESELNYNPDRTHSVSVETIFNSFRIEFIPFFILGRTLDPE